MTLEIKLITSQLVCCRDVHVHGMLRLGISRLILWGNCWFVCFGSEPGRKTEDQNCWDRYDCSWKVLWIGSNYRNNRDPVPILPVKSKCMPQGGMEGMYRVANGCTQPDGRKVSSADPNGEWFLSGGGSLGSGVVWLTMVTMIWAASHWELKLTH